MDILERLRQTPVTKDLKTDTAVVLAAAVWWTLLREVAVRFFLAPIASRYVISVSPDEVAASVTSTGTTSHAKATDADLSSNAAHDGTKANGNGASKAVSQTQRTAGARNGKPISKRERRRLEHLQRRNETRFSEQGWSVLYYSCSFSIGLYVSIHQPWWPFRVKEFWTDYPELTIDALLKYYYLAQTAFYVHQVFVLFSEARRKDHWQMFGHHIITIGLQGASYATHYHRVGVAIMMLLDPSDILLSAAKMLRYVGFQAVCDVFFGLFLLSWLLCRHILFNVVLYSVIVDTVTHPQTDTSKGDYATHTAKRIFITMLASLQVILLIWFVMIVKVAWRVITGSGAADTRSDDEDENEDEFDLTEGTEDETPLGAHENGNGLNGASSTSIKAAAPARQRAAKA